MKSVNMKVALSAVAIAVLATPAFAQLPYYRVSRQLGQLQDYAGSEAIQYGQPEHYPNGAAPTGTVDSIESGAEFNLRY